MYERVYWRIRSTIASSKITVKWDESKLADVIYFARGEEERACEALKFNDDDYDVAELADFRREMHQYNAEKLKNDVKIIESQYIAAMMKINYQPEQSTADTTESGDVAGQSHLSSRCSPKI